MALKKKKSGKKQKKNKGKKVLVVKSRINESKVKKEKPELVLKIKKSGKKIEFSKTKIKLIGIGGGGNSILSEIASIILNSERIPGKALKNIDFIALNTDSQALSRVSKNCKKMGFGEKLTEGLGCGMSPDLGEKAANLEREKIKDFLEGGDFYILIACLGGGTGSGAAPVIAEICNGFKKSSLGIFTLPFKFEGSKKNLITKNSLKKMRASLNALSIIPNEKIFQLVDQSTPLKKALSLINKKLAFDLEGLVEMISKAGLINVDWADFKMILGSNGSSINKGKLCYLNRVRAKDENRASKTVKSVVHSALNEYGIKGADRILFNIEADRDLKMSEVEEMSSFISDFNRNARIIFGISILSRKYFSPNFSKPGNSEIGITLMATGMEKRLEKKKKQIVKKEDIVEKKDDEKKEAKEEKDEKEATKEKKETKIRVKGKDKSSFKVVPKKKKVKAKKKLKKEEKSILGRKTVRKNALAVKKDVEKEEREILMKEKKWEMPAFLRKQEHE